MNWEALLLSFAAFLAFSLFSRFIMNDLFDLKADRAHRKCMRSYASGRIPIEHGIIIIDYSVWYACWQISRVIILIDTSSLFYIEHMYS